MLTVCVELEPAPLQGPVGADREAGPKSCGHSGTGGHVSAGMAGREVARCDCRQGEKAAASR